MNDAAYLIDAATRRIVLWDAGAERLFGFVAAEAVGSDPAELLRTRPESLAGADDALAARGRWEGDVAHRLADGDELTVRSRRTLLRDAGGAPAHVVIAERAPETVVSRGAGSRLARIAATLPGMICELRLSPDGRLSMPYAGPGLHRISGIAPEDVATDASALFAGVLPEDATTLRESIEHSARTLEPWAGSWRLQHPTRGVCWLEGQSVPEAEPDGSVLWTGYVLDVTERRRAEEELRLSRERLRLVFDSTSVGIVARDPEGLIVECNRAYAGMLGFAPDELLGTDYNAVGGPEDVERFERRFRESWAAGRDGTEFEHRYLHRDGHVVEASVVASFVRDDAGRPLYQLALVEDVSESRRVEQQLLEAQKMDAVGRLAGGVAHDFNNMLSAILGFNEIVAHELGADHPLAPDVAEVRVAAERARDLTQQLLAFSRRQLLSREDLDVGELLDTLAPLLTHMVGEDIDLVVSAGGSSAVVRADRHQLEQVVVNLAVNAGEAMLPGGTLSLSAGTETVQSPGVDLGAGRYVVITVADTGRGMDEETQRRMFEPFFTTKGVGEGSGLGLSTAIGVVDQMGGTIDVDSRLGRGTTVKVYLPEAQRSLAGAEGEEPAAAAPDVATVLLVEDDDAVRTLTQRLLERDGHSVLAAASGGEAEQIIAAHGGTIDLLLTDVILPGIDGHQLAGRVLAQRPGIRVLYTSGYSGDEMVGRGLEPGDHFLQKPFLPEDLRAKVDEALRDPASED